MGFVYYRLPPLGADGSSEIMELKRAFSERASASEVSKMLLDDVAVVAIKTDVNPRDAILEVFAREAGGAFGCEVEAPTEDVLCLGDAEHGGRYYLVTNETLNDTLQRSGRVEHGDLESLFNPLASRIANAVMPHRVVFGTCFVVNLLTDDVTTSYVDVDRCGLAELVRRSMMVDIFHLRDGVVPYDREALQCLDPAGCEVDEAAKLVYVPRYNLALRYAEPEDADMAQVFAATHCRSYCDVGDVGDIDRARLA